MHIAKLKRFIQPFRISHEKGFDLRSISPGDTGGLESKEGAKGLLKRGVERLSELQEKLFAQDKWAVLLVFQAMDAAGKDSTIKHVMSGVNPQGCEVHSFKAPSNEELDHDFLWRTNSRLPERGRIGIFNRSYYEETLIVRVHPELLKKQKLPAERITDDIWTHRFEDINNYEQYLCRNGILVLKFFLHVSKKEQKERFLERLDQPEKNWKFAFQDAQERKYWDKYMAAYEDMIRHTATKHAPWHVVPADHKWFTRLVVSATIVEALESLNLKFPQMDAAKRRELAEARRVLE